MKLKIEQLSWVLIGLLFVGCGPKFSEENKGDFHIVNNDEGQEWEINR